MPSLTIEGIVYSAFLSVGGSIGSGSHKTFWSRARNANVTDDYFISPETGVVSITRGGLFSGYGIVRSGLIFNISTIPQNIRRTSVTLNIYCNEIWGGFNVDTPCNLVIYSAENLQCRGDSDHDFAHVVGSVNDEPKFTALAIGDTDVVVGYNSFDVKITPLSKHYGSDYACYGIGDRLFDYNDRAPSTLIWKSGCVLDFSGTNKPQLVIEFEYVDPPDPPDANKINIVGIT